MRSLIPALFIAAGLAACSPAGDQADRSEALAEAGAAGTAPQRGRNNPVAREAENVVLPPVENITDTPPAISNYTNQAATPVVNEPAAAPGPEARPANVIPAQYRGRWGMVPADCTSTRGDAKGLITVDATSIRFYESVSRLAEVRPAVGTSFSGLFRFTGEGMNWTKVQTLTRTGDSLTRAEEEGTFRYTRCV
jgi:hypothetical protein